MASTGFSPRYEACSGTNRLKNLLFVILCILIAAVITGCGEETEEPVTADFTADGAAVGTIGAMKMPIEAAPAAPSAPTDGTPYVKSVGYYSDWQLTEEIDNETPVPVGTLVYVHVVFSEPMSLRVTDNEEGRDPRPVLYYLVGGETTRFRMMPHGASGEDFVSGDAKPKGGGTDDFVCKYRVKPKDNGSQFWIRVGEWSADLEWNKMNEAYAHKPRLRLGEPEEEPEQVTEQPAEEAPKPTEPTTPAPEEVTPLTVVSITHYRDRESTLIPEGTSVEHNTTVRTNIVFAEPIDPTSVIVTYTTGGETKRFSYSTGGVHWRGTFQVNGNKKRIFCKQFAREDSFTVTLQEAKGLSGSTLTEPIIAPTIPVGTQAVVPTPEPTEPQTSVDTQPTTPDEPTQPTAPQPRPPTVPIPSTPVPTAPQGADYSFEDGVYIVGGETYPGYNPSPKLQHILDTHPSARLPYFLEAVKMVEVIDWAYRKSWKMYPGIADEKSLIAIREAVLNHFGTSLAIGRIMSVYYFRTTELHPGHSKYWLTVEYLRLKLANPGADAVHLLRLFDTLEGHKKVVGIENPNE